MKPIKVCFVSLYSYSLFNPRANLVFGGSEVRAALFGKEIAKDPRFQVSFVVLNHDKHRRERFGNITVWRHSGYRSFSTPPERFKAAVKEMVEKKDRFPFFRFRRITLVSLGKLFPSLIASVGFSLKRSFTWRPMKPLTIAGEKVAGDKVAIYQKIDADIYCVIGVSEVSAEVATFAATNGKKVVLLCGSDYDLSPLYAAGSTERNIYGCRGGFGYHALAAADQIVTQTSLQARLLRERFGRPSVIIRNPIELSATIPPLRGRRFALWIGKSDNIKQPELALELARRLPNVRLVMVLNRCLEDKFHRIVADRPANVTIIEHVPIDKIERLFARAFAFVSTSRFEGFPNTFLQAGKYAVPVLSLQVDPDGYLEKYHCGIVAGGSLDRLTEGLSRFAFDFPLRERIGAKHRTYVEENHDLSKMARQLRDVIVSCVSEADQAEPNPRSLDSIRKAS